MTPAEANVLLTYARGLDNFIPNTDANLDAWASALEHVPLEAGKVIVRDYYGKHPNPDERKPITAAHVRRLFRQRSTVYEARERAAHQLPRPKRRRPPRRFVERMQQLGMLTDRDPSHYPRR